MTFGKLPLPLLPAPSNTTSPANWGGISGGAISDLSISGQRIAPQAYGATHEVPDPYYARRRFATRGAQVAAQPFSSFVPFEIIPNRGAAGYEFMANRRPSPGRAVEAVHQQFKGWQPSGNVPSPVTPYGWWEPQRAEARKRPVLTHPHWDWPWQVITATVVQPYGAAGFHDGLRAQALGVDSAGKFSSPLLIAFPQPYGAAGFFDGIKAPVLGPDSAGRFGGTFTPQGDIFSITPQGWVPSYPDKLKLFTALGAALQQFYGAFQPLGTIVSTTPQGWWQPFAEALAKPFKATLQRHVTFQPLGAVVSITPQGWWQPLAEARVQPVKATLQQFWAATLRPFPQPYGAEGYEWMPELAGTPQQRPAISGQVHAYWQPLDNVPSPTTPYGWWQPLADSKAKPLATLLLEHAGQFTSFQVTVVQPYGAAGYEFTADRSGAMAFPSVTLQQWAAFQPQGSIFSLTPQGWWQPHSEALRKPFASAQHPHSAFQAQGFVTSEFPSGWFQPFPDRIIKPLAASLQAHTTFTATGFVTSTFPDGWRGQGVEPKALRLVINEHGAFSLSPFVQPQGAGTAFDEMPRQSSRKPVQPFSWDGGVPQSYAVAVVSGFLAPFPDLFARPVRVTLQQWQSEPPEYQVPSPTTPYGWWVPLDVRIRAPFRASLQQYDQWLPNIAAFTTQTQAFLGHWPSFDWITRKPLRDALQRFAEFQPQGTIVSVTPQGWSQFFDRSRYGQMAPDRAWGFQALGTIVISTPQGWWQPFPELLKHPLAPAQQRFNTFTVQGDIFSITPQGWWPQSPPTELFRRPLASSLHRYAFFTAQGTITSVTPQGWSQFFDKNYVAPFRASLQRHATFQALGTIGLTPQGWSAFHDRASYGQMPPDKAGGWPPQSVPTPVFYGWWSNTQHPELLKAPFKPPFQQYELHAFFAVPTADTPQGWWQPLSINYIRPLRASLQQWTGQLPRIVPVFGTIRGHPHIIGFKIEPDLRATDQQSSLIGADVKPSLRSTDREPDLDGADTEPSLKGKVES